MPIKISVRRQYNSEKTIQAYWSTLYVDLFDIFIIQIVFKDNANNLTAM